MLNRGQFTFYRSFWEAIKVLPKKDRLPILEAIISYALDGTEPSELTQSQLAFFSLVRPNLDTARRKAGGGSAKTSVEDNGKMPQRPTKDTDNKKKGEKEKEKENENENEIEGENDKRSTPEAPPPDGGKPPVPPKTSPSFDGQSFSSFWNAYPDGPGKISRESTYTAWKALAPSKETAASILSSLEAWKKSSRWLDNGGAFVPSAANFLTKGYWKTTPAPAAADKKGNPADTPRKLDDDEREAIRRLLSESGDEVPQ